MSYPQTLKYEIKVKTGFHSPNEVEDSCVGIQSTTFVKLCSLDIILFYCVVKQRSCSIPLNAMNSTLLGRVPRLKTQYFQCSRIIDTDNIKYYSVRSKKKYIN